MCWFPSFFDELPDDDVAGIRHTKTSPAEVECGQLLEKETLELIRAYYGILDEESRKGIANLVIALAEVGQVPAI